MGLTPMMRQYLEIKENYKDCILFFRLGDFYEMFFDDAKSASRELELVLTGRDCGLEERAPMCGIPFHAANGYIGRLVSKGYKVAICEQVEDPSVAKGIVKRDVVKVITPGTYVDPQRAESNENTYLMAIVMEDGETGLALTDISTGEFKVTSFESSKATMIDEIIKVSPKEIVIDKSWCEEDIRELEITSNSLITIKDFNKFKCSIDELKAQFGPHEVSGLKNIELITAEVLLQYVYETQKQSLTNLNFLEKYNIINYMTLDGSSRRNLELTENIREKNKRGSLLWVLDKSATTMGGRALRKCIDEPLLRKFEIEKRLNAVEELFNSLSFNEDIRDSLKEIYDIERIVGKIASSNVNGKDLVSLKSSLNKLPNIKDLLSNANCELLKEYYNDLDTLDDVKELLEKSLLNDPPLTIKEGNIIKDGYNSEVDELRVAKVHGKEWIASLENKEREFTGIKSLKVGYNKVFGYYIEISKANYSSIPEGRYIRKQTLANAERYITEELKVMEEKILGAEEKLTSLEYNLFLEIRNLIEKEIPRLKKTARVIASLDVVSTLALVAIENDYVKPSINEDGIIEIEEGRHPVVEKVIGKGEFVSNNTLLNKKDNRLLLITGPNMAGKSTYMRQVALITLMAQMGSFVPAKRANINLCDKIFTRIGASDDLAGGKSTFMVEMWEVSNILKNATNNSLVLLDEVGRGTSTYDGLSIAWAVIEHLSKEEKLKCNTLFATHYHELTRLEGVIEGVKNYSVAVKEIDDNIIFLRKIIEGGADQSYGIEVAKLAGLPKSLIERAKDILSHLEGDKVEVSQNQNVKEVAVDRYKETETVNKDLIYKEIEENLRKEFEEEYKKKVELLNKKEKSNSKGREEEASSMQLDFTYVEKESLIKEVANVDVLGLTPLAAMNKLYELVNEAKRLL